MRDFALTAATVITIYLLIVTAGWYATHARRW